MIIPLYIGLLAGLLQAVGYFLYYHFVVRCERRPNGMSWFMWAYGTFVFFFIEFDIAAPLSVLLLPLICTISALVIAGYSFYKSSYIPPEKQDYFVLSIDVALLISYLGILALLSRGYILQDQHIMFGGIFLILTSLSTLTSFYPILRTTFESPRDEHPLPWLVWTLAYAFLLYTVLLENIGLMYAVYPILNILMHGAMTLFALTDEDRTLPWKRKVHIYQ